MPLSFRRPLLTLCVLWAASLQASVLELFAKASASKNYSAADKYTISVSASAGLAVALLSQIRVEGRYINISSLQNKVDVITSQFSGFLKDIKTQTKIYSLGFDIDLLGEKSVFQPFLFIGAGYFESDRSYFVVITDGTSSGLIRDSKQTGISANAGLGFKLRIARRLAFEVEVYGYSTEINKPNPLLNLFGSAGIRIYI